MENGLNLSCEYKTLMNELTQGMEKAKQLHFHLCSTSPSEDQDSLLQRILSSYERALSILRLKGSSSAGHESSVTVDESPRTQVSSKILRERQDRNASKKRKQPTWREQVRVNSENGLDGPSDDGHGWRKYGQKDILGAKFPRSYYRCTYRLVRNCLATKQVQRSHDDPNVFDITYKGTHTCDKSTDSVQPEPGPEQEHKHNPDTRHQQQNQALLDFKSNLRVSTGNSDDNEHDTPPQFSFPSTYSINYEFPVPSFDNCAPFLSPEISEMSYFSQENQHVWEFGGYNCKYRNSGSDIAEIVSSHASATNSPIGGVGFPSDFVDLDPSFFPF